MQQNVVGTAEITGEEQLATGTGELDHRCAEEHVSRTQETRITSTGQRNGSIERDRSEKFECLLRIRKGGLRGNCLVVSLRGSAQADQRAAAGPKEPVARLHIRPARELIVDAVDLRQGAIRPTCEVALSVRMETVMKWFKSSLIVLSIALVQSAQGQELGDIKSGLSYAEAVCAECHAVKKGERTSPHERAPAFDLVANARGMTDMALRVWFQSSHPSMPNLMLKEKTADDLIAYIRSLKQDGRPRSRP